MPHCPTSSRKFPEEVSPKLISQPHYSFPSIIQWALHILPSCKAAPDPISSSEEEELTRTPPHLPSQLSPGRFRIHCSGLLGLTPLPPGWPFTQLQTSQWRAGLKSLSSLKKSKKRPVSSGCGGYTYSADLHPRRATLGTSFRRQDLYLLAGSMPNY